MDVAAEAREFLVACRSRVTPESVGLLSVGHRRVPGLRREEVAVLAGVSAAYYRRLERGHLGGVSDGVLQALAGALQLEDVERRHLFSLARAASAPGLGSEGPRPAATTLRPAVRQILYAMANVPALARTPGMDVVGANALGRALFSSMFDVPGPANVARFVFLNPAAQQLYGDWTCATRQVVAALRAAAFEHPHDQPLGALIDELSSRSGAFRTAWADHEVRHLVNGVKLMYHPTVGELALDFERLEVLGDGGLTIFAYSAAPGSSADQALRLLGSWAATREHTAIG